MVEGVEGGRCRVVDEAQQKRIGPAAQPKRALPNVAAFAPKSDALLPKLTISLPGFDARNRIRY